MKYLGLFLGMIRQTKRTSTPISPHSMDFSHFDNSMYVPLISAFAA